MIAAALSAASVAPLQAQTTPEFYTVEFNLRYEITLPTSMAAADQLGVPLDGTVLARMIFPRPDCLGHFDGQRATYPATFTEAEMFDQSGTSVMGDNPRNAAPSESNITFENDVSGHDRVILNLRAGEIATKGAPVTSVTLATFNLPDDAIADTSFVTNEGLLQNIFEYPQLDVYAQIAGSSTRTFTLTPLDISVDIDRAGAVGAGSFADCTP